MDVLASSYAKLDRARQFIVELEREMFRYFESKPFKFYTNRYGYFGIGITAVMDKKVDVIVGEVLHNLRSAIDHSIFSWLTHETTKVPLSKIYFPCSHKSKEDFLSK